jgi:hypothetical protein
VKIEISQDSTAPFFPVLAVCDSAQLEIIGEANTEEAMFYLMQNTKIRYLFVRHLSKCNTEFVRSLASVIESATDLKTIRLYMDLITSEQLSLISAALQNQKKPEVFFNGGQLEDSLPAFFNCLASKGIRKVGMYIPDMISNAAESLASWISSPSCSLVDLSVINLRNAESTSILLHSIKENRSIRCLKLHHLETSGSLFADAIVQQGHIETLDFAITLNVDVKSIVKMMLSSKQLQCENADFYAMKARIGDPYLLQQLHEYIVSPTCVTRYSDLRKLLWSFYTIEHLLLDALRNNTTIREVSVDLSRTDIDENCCVIIGSCSSLRSVSLTDFSNCSDLLVAALNKSKNIECIRLEENFSRQPTVREIRKMISAIAQVRTLQELRLHCSLDSCVSELSSLIRKCNNLRVVNIAHCFMSQATLIQLLEALASNSKLERLDMSELSLEGQTRSRDPLNKALVNLLKTNPLQILNMGFQVLDPSTINAIVAFVDGVITLHLRIWSLYAVNMSTVTRNNVESLVARKCGLLTVNF